MSRGALPIEGGNRSGQGLYPIGGKTRAGQVFSIRG